MRKEIKTGLFAVIVIAAALFTIEFLKGKDIFSRTDTYYAVYPAVDGVEPSTAVTIGGFAAGRVTSVEYNRATMNYTVGVSVSREFRIPADSRLEVYSADIMGTRKIRLTAGTSDMEAAPGDTLSGSIVPDMISSLAGNLTPLAEDMDSLVRNINSTVTSLNLILDSSTRIRIDGILENLDRITQDLAIISGTVRDKSPEISGIVTRLHSMSASLDSAASAAVGTLSNTEAVTASLRDAGLGAAVDSLRNLIVRIQNPSGSIGSLISSDSLYNSLTRLSNDLDSLVRGIKADPKKYIKISVF